MLTSLQKHAPTISILLLVALLIALFFYPPSSRVLSTLIILFGIGTAIIFTVQGNWALRQAQEPHKEGGLTNAAFIRNTIIDLLGLVLIMGLAMWLGRLAGGYAGANWGMLAGIVAGIAVGFSAAFLVQRIWGMLTNRWQATPASPSG